MFLIKDKRHTHNKRDERMRRALTERESQRKLLNYEWLMKRVKV